MPVFAANAQPKNFGRTTVPVPAAAANAEAGTAGSDAAADAEKSPAKVFADIAEASAPIVISTPLYAETKNLQDRAFDADAKLRTEIPNLEKIRFTPAAADKDGFFTVAVPVKSEREAAKEKEEKAGKSDGNEKAAAAQTTVPAKFVAADDTLVLFRFFVTPQSFSKTRVHLISPQKCELRINGARVADKLSTEEELEKAGEAGADFNFEEGRYEIVGKILVQAGTALPAAAKLEIESKSEGCAPAIVFTNGKEKAPLTIAEVNSETERVAGVSLSPDGKYALVTYSKLNSDASHSRRIEVRSTLDWSTVYTGDAGRACAWMPNGARLYFRRPGVNGRFSYIEYDVARQRERVLAENLPSENYQYVWLPDESGFIVSKTEKWSDESPDWTRVLNLSDRSERWRDRTFLLRYDLKKGIFEQLTAGAQTTALSGISPDSSRLLFETLDVDYTQPEFIRAALYSLDLKTLECTPIFENEKYSVSLMAFSPDSKKIVLVSGPDAFGGIGSALPPGQTGNSFDLQAFVYDFETKTFEAITKNFDPSVLGGIWAGDGNIYFHVNERDMKNIYRFSPETKTFTKLNVPADNIFTFDVQEKAENFVPAAFAIGGGAVAFSKLYKIDLANNAAVPVRSADVPAPEEKFVFPEFKKWEFTASDGTTIDGYYYLPTNFDPEKKYPMIVYYYGGTMPTVRGIGGHYPFPLYAALGYVVYVVEPSGTIGYGQEFSARHLNAWGKRTADDIIEGTKKFCAEHAFVNPKKIGCIGASYGGFMTMYLQTRTDIFAAAVAHAGISDITSYWGEGFWGAAYNAVAAAGSFPWKNREIFVDQSPLFAADKINTPILLCHGTDDTNVPVGESIQMFAALKILGKPVELLTFADEDHGIMNYTRRKQWLKSHLAWFARWLKDEPDWWNTLYPDKNW